MCTRGTDIVIATMSLTPRVYLLNERYVHRLCVMSTPSSAPRVQAWDDKVSLHEHQIDQICRNLQLES